MNNLMQILNPHNPMLYVLIIWSGIWKGITLWRSARNKQLIWYILLLIVNTAGILEILYLIFFQRNRNNSL
jgi:hypothetical protein